MYENGKGAERTDFEENNMEIRLGKNIRAFSKQRSLTQEQLAEVLGVSTGAVYKWEADLSIPELGMILEMADFFDTSVDVLLGYEMRDNRLETSLLLFDQNTDPMGDKIIVYQNMATVYEELTFCLQKTCFNGGWTALWD